MKRCLFLILVALTACSESGEEIPLQQSECRLLKIVAHADQTVNTEYSYNEKNQIVGQTRIRGGVLDFTYVISYTPDGKVSTVDVGGDIIEYSYTSDGKLESQTFRAKTNGLVTEVRTYSWTTNALKAVYKKTGEQNPYATMDYEFVGENIVHTLYRTFSDFDSEVLSFKEEVTYSDFDTGINHLYLALLRRPGYAVQSKNNPGQSVTVTTLYVGGIAQAPQTTVVNYTYVYNSSKATTSFVTSTVGGSSYLTDVTYDECP